MRQEFLTVYGRASIENETLHIRSFYLPFEKTAFAQIAIEALWIISFTARLLSIETSMHIMMTIVWGALLLTRIPSMYDKFFKRSYSARIPLSFVSQITTLADIHGIQTEAILRLRNGRYKKIVFRNHEGQLEPFLAVFPSKQVLVGAL